MKTFFLALEHFQSQILLIATYLMNHRETLIDFFVKRAHTEIPSQFIDAHRSPMGPIDPNGPSMSIDEVFLTMIPSMGHRWAIDEPSMDIKISITKIRSTWPCSKFHKSRHLSLSVYLSFVWDFEGV